MQCNHGCLSGAIKSITSHPGFKGYMQTHGCRSPVAWLLSEIEATVFDNKIISYAYGIYDHYPWCPYPRDTVEIPCVCLCTFIGMRASRAIRLLDAYESGS